MTNKEKTIIKRFFKSVENNNDFYNTYYQDENGLYYLINMYSCIRFTARREDIIKEYGLKSGDPKKISRLNIKEIIENNTNKNYNYYSATVSAADLRAFKAYAKRENKPFLTCYNSIQYIGFNPSYMLDIFDLMKTSENTIYIYDSKSPIILNSADFDAFILPINTRNTDITTYSDFLTTLNDLKSIQEKKKEEKKNAKNLTKLEYNNPVNGFEVVCGNVAMFIATENTRKSDKLAKQFIDILCKIKEINATDEQKAASVKDFKNMMMLTTYELIQHKTESGKIYTWIDFKTNNAAGGYSIDDIKNRVYIFNEQLERVVVDIFGDLDTTDNTTQDTTAATTDTNSRTTETMQADARQDTRQTETPAHKSNNCLFVTVAKDLKPEKVAQLQNVANLPTLASIPTYSAYLAHKINNIVNTKCNTNNGRKAHKRTNGATLAECAGVLKVANTS